MSRALTILPLFAVILMTAPRHAAAQETPMNLGIPRVSNVEPRRDVAPAPTPTRMAHDGTVGRGDVVARVAAEASVELLTLGALGVAPALAAGLSAQPCAPGAYVCLGPDFFAEFFGAIGGTIALAFTPFLVSLAGDAVGGRGNTGAAYLGMLAGGALAGGALALGVASNDPSVLGAMLVVGGLCALVGPILGYELSDGEARRAPHTGTSTAWIPTFGVSRDGATIGVAAQL